MNEHQNLLNSALRLHQSGHIREAIDLYNKVLPWQRNNAQLLYLLGTANLQLGQRERGMELIQDSLAINPGNPTAHYNIGLVLQELKRLDEALASYDRALALKPDYANAYSNRGVVLQDLKRPEDALASHDKALAIAPDYADAHSNRGNVLQDLKRLDEALASYGKAVAINPDFAGAYFNRGIALQKLKRMDEALASYDKALAIAPDYAEALSNRGTALNELKYHQEALASCDRALALNPDHADALNNRGLALYDLGHIGQALASFEKALSADPGHLYAFGNLANAALRLCDWKRTTSLAGDVEAHARNAKSIIAPLAVLGYSDDASVQLECARRYTRDKVSFPRRPLWNGPIHRHGKIRIAYLSGDFRQHAMAYLLAELYERHDRSRFEVMGISLGEDDGSEMRARLIRAFDQFHDVRSQSDLDVARLLHGLEVDIVVDLNGHTRRARPEILSYRPCPVQVNYLGYPGTMGADFVDYIIADHIVLPTDQAAFFTEKIVRLPDCYQANDSRRAISTATPARQDLGLPEAGFVFCCFNNNWKITAPVFDIWMRLLGSVPGSVLWLIEDSPETKANLLAGALARGVDPERLVFAPRVKLEDHLARHRLADLFLDTLPYNAHTTASDALWAGLPLITCRGASFASRVAASLLHAIGLPELVTHDLEAYEALALTLARDEALLRSVRTKLDQNRPTYPLFDTNRLRRNIEKAYVRMLEIAGRGEAPQSFRVEPDA